MTDPFSPSSKTVNVSGTTSAASVQVSNQVGKQQIRVVNPGTTLAFVAFGDSNVAATTTASLPVLPSTSPVFTVIAPYGGSALYASAILASGTSNIYFTPGAGI